MTGASIVEQAYDLARSGQFRSVSEIIRRLPVDDRPSLEAHLAQPGSRRELILLCGNAWLATQ
jgi:hypothetical protein